MMRDSTIRSAELREALRKMEDALELLDGCDQPLVAAQLASAIDTLTASLRHPALLAR